MKKKIHFICVLVICLIMVPICSGAENAESDQTGDKIGVSIIDKNPYFASDMVGVMREQLSDLNMDILYHEPETYSASWQLEDIRGMLDDGISYLVVLPSAENQAFHSLMEEVAAAGVKIVLINYTEDEHDYAELEIRIDPVGEGRLCADKLAELFEGKQCRVVEIVEDARSILSTLRAKGFEQQAAQYDYLTIVEKGSGGGNAHSAQSVMETIVQRSGQISFNAIFSCTDEDGIGVMRALEEANLQPGTYYTLISIGGDEDVKKAIAAKKYTATVQYTEDLSLAAARAIRTAGGNVDDHERMITLQPVIVEVDNVTDYFSGVGQ